MFKISVVLTKIITGSVLFRTGNYSILSLLYGPQHRTAYPSFGSIDKSSGISNR